MDRPSGGADVRNNGGLSGERSRRRCCSLVASTDPSADRSEWSCLGRIVLVADGVHCSWIVCGQRRRHGYVGGQSLRKQVVDFPLVAMLIAITTVLTVYTMSKSKRLSDFLHALSDERL